MEIFTRPHVLQFMEDLNSALESEKEGDMLVMAGYLQKLAEILSSYQIQEKKIEKQILKKINELEKQLQFNYIQETRRKFSLERI